MDKQRTTLLPADETRTYVLPQWDVPKRRRLLDRRVRSVRRSLIAGGLVGTVAFSALAGYETKIAHGAAGTQTASVTTTNQTSNSNMFSDQESTGLSTATATATATAEPTATATATAVAKTTTRSRSS